VVTAVLDLAVLAVTSTAVSHGMMPSVAYGSRWPLPRSPTPAISTVPPLSSCRSLTAQGPRRPRISEQTELVLVTAGDELAEVQGVGIAGEALVAAEEPGEGKMLGSSRSGS
jgi:hypothetical protein